MATIDYKEKYEQALERAKYYHDRDNIQFLENIFPELKESEDERIRKHIIGVLRDHFSGEDTDKCIAWLEKQGEQKPADKVEQKFKVGDKVLVDGKVYTIKLVNEDNYIVDENGRDVQEHFSYTKDWKLYEQKPTAWSEEDETALGDALWCCKQAASIAKNENDMGNVWYAETWLKAIKDRVQPQPKNEWSEEDEMHIRELERLVKQVWAIAEHENNKDTIHKMSDLSFFLKTLKPQLKQDEQKPVVDTKVIIPKFRVGDIVKSKSQPMLSPRKIISIGKDCYWCEDRGCIGFAWEDDCEIVEQNPAWSEEDEDNFKHLLDEIVCLGNNRNSANRLYYDRLIKFIEELKNRAQPKEKWCDKDERMLDRLIAYFEKQVAFTDDDNPRYANWLKSIRPQNRWKPSDGQMLAIDTAINVLGKGTLNGKQLIELQEQLKKLKGEEK